MVVVESEPRFSAQGSSQSSPLSSCLVTKGQAGPLQVWISGSSSLLFLPLYSEDKQYEVRWLFKPTKATSATNSGGRKVQRSVYVRQITPSYGDSCGRSPSRRHQRRTGTKGRRHSTRSAPLCGGRGWCGSAGRPGLTIPWVSSSAGRGCRSWSRPVCWPSEGFPVHTATKKSQNIWSCELFGLFLLMC